jgi:hypothetical protein
VHDVLRFGAVGDGKTDCSAAFQSAVDTAAESASKTVLIPPGRFLLRRPVLVDGVGVRVVGVGEESHVQVEGMNAGFVFGVRRVEKEGRVIDASYRPDAFGKLDAHAAPERGVRRGFASRGKVLLEATAHPAQVGMRTARSEDRCFDYWGEFRRFTLELCFEPTAGQPWKPHAPLLGLGSAVTEPGPWALAVGDTAEDLVFSFKTGDMPEEYDSGDRVVFVPLKGSKPPYRLRIWLDFDAGKAGATVNERVVADAVSDRNARGKPWKAGLRFLRTRARHLFLVGTSGESPDLDHGAITPLDLYGLRVSRAVRGKPAHDAQAYLEADADTVFYLPLTGAPGRTIDLATGRAADGMAGTAYLLHGDGYLGGIDSNAITDLRITGGAPSVLLGGVRRFRIERVRAGDGMVGLGSLPMVVSYPVTIRDCELSGFDAAVSLWRCEVRASGLDLERGGQTSMRFHGCSASVQDCMFYFNSGIAETAVDILRGEGWGRYSLRNLNVDNEGHGFERAVVRCESPAYTRGVLAIDGLEVSRAGKTCALIELVDHTEGGGWFPSRVDVTHLDCYTQDHGAVLRVDGPNWYGQIDTSLLRPPHLDYRGKTGTTAVRLVTERPFKE